MAGYIINTKKIITAVVRSLTHRLQPQHGILRHNSAGSCVLRRKIPCTASRYIFLSLHLHSFGSNTWCNTLPTKGACSCQRYHIVIILQFRALLPILDDPLKQATRMKYESDARILPLCMLLRKSLHAYRTRHRVCCQFVFSFHFFHSMPIQTHTIWSHSHRLQVKENS
jgi:hypothetical protein